MFKGITGNVLILGIVSFLTDVSSEMIYQLLPIFLTTVLGAGPAFLGLIEGVAESTAAFLKLASGILSDCVRSRKGLVLAGYTLSSIARPLMAVAAAPATVLAIRFADRVGKGVRTSPCCSHRRFIRSFAKGKVLRVPPGHAFELGGVLAAFSALLLCTLVGTAVRK